jgi:hypothetical protein
MIPSAQSTKVVVANDVNAVTVEVHGLEDTRLELLENV